MLENAKFKLNIVLAFLMTHKQISNVSILNRYILRFKVDIVITRKAEVMARGENILYLKE